jgi:hypothetical protein
MRANPYEQFDPSDAWRATEGFLRLHGRTPDGEGLPAGLVDLLMVGVWTGCRLALIERELALGIAATGNAQSNLVFDALQRGFDAEFGESMQEVVGGVLRQRGFTEASVELGGTGTDWLDEAAAVEAAERLLRASQADEGGAG